MSKVVYYIDWTHFRHSLMNQKVPVRVVITTKRDQSTSTTVVGQSQGRWRRLWRSWLVPTSVGVTVLAVLQWRRLQRARDENRVSIAKNWEITCYRAVPCRALSRAWGWLSSRPVPTQMRGWVYGVYSSMYGVNLDEMAGDLMDYPSLGQFFTRELKQGVRPINPTSCIVSPADGKILNCGEICSCHVEQIKGVTYKLQTFLGEPTWRVKHSAQYRTESSKNNTNLVLVNQRKLTDENSNEVVVESDTGKGAPNFFWGGVDIVKYLFKANREQDLCVFEDWDEYKSKLLTNPNNQLFQAVVYLAPGDYHRFHSPINWKVNFRRHFQGELLSVNPLIAGWVPELFSLNERVVYVGEWQHGFFSMTAVGATNVGSIRVHCDETLHTNTRKWRDGCRHRDRVMNLEWKKGEEVGEFRMGSTIVLIFEAPKGYEFSFGPSEKVKVGESLCLQN